MTPNPSEELRECRREIKAFNRLEDLIIELAPQQCRQHSLGAADILRKFAKEYRALLHENHLLRHGHLKP